MMDLEQRMVDGVRIFSLSLSSDHSTHLIQRHGKLTFVAQHHLPGNEEQELGRITFGPGGAKLQAFDTLHILPGHLQANSNSSVATDPLGPTYQLDPRSEGRVEIIILRHGDVITSPKLTDSVACMWRAPGVQVNSSATDLAQVAASKANNGIDETPEEETEDEAVQDDTVTEVPVTQPVTQPSKSQPSATPHLVTSRSVIVQETPTTDRVLGVDEYKAAPSNEDQHGEPTPPHQVVTAVTETFSTARTGQSPKSVEQDSVNTGLLPDRRQPQSSPEVRISARRPRKRSINTASPEAEPFTDDPPAKRTKNVVSVREDEGDVVQNSPLDNINADPSRRTYSAKAKKRFADTSETTPTKSTRSSQRSATATTTVAYEGEPPRVATSNSAIKDGNAAVKFLRKHGGTLVTSVEDKCNILCVRDGGLAKTMKVIQAIALGVPIVTDKWLIESAKTEDFLDLSSFKPSVAQQEKEWGFDLEKVWGVAQTPFKGYTLYFTPALKKTYTNFREMDRVCQTVGAKVTTKRTAKNEQVIVLAKEEEDPDADKMIEDGEICYHKDLLTTSILRGTLDLDSDEFKIKAKHAGAPRRKGPRTSS